MTDTTNRRLRACIAACEGIETEVLESLGRGGLKDELDLCDHLLTKMEVILVRTVNAIRGEPEPLHRHGWHDLPERAQAVMAALGMAIEVAAETMKERDALRAELDAISAAIGTCEFMDPPDGGSVALHEQVKRMRSELDTLHAWKEKAEKQEPVAWRTFDGEGGYDYRSVCDNEDYRNEFVARNPNHTTWVDGLYLHPVHAQSVPDGQAVRLLRRVAGHLRWLKLDAYNYRNQHHKTKAGVESLQKAISDYLAAAQKPEVQR